MDLKVLPTWTRLPDEEEIRIRVDLPAGSQRGPQVSDRLGYWSVTSQPCWHALLALPFMWDNPGRTLVPAGNRGHWARSKDMTRYPVLRIEDLVKLVFPLNRNRQPLRKMMLPRALDRLELLHQEQELFLVDKGETFQVLPPEFHQ